MYASSIFCLISFFKAEKCVKRSEAEVLSVPHFPGILIGIREYAE